MRTCTAFQKCHQAATKSSSMTGWKNARVCLVMITAFVCPLGCTSGCRSQVDSSATATNPNSKATPASKSPSADEAGGPVGTKSSSSPTASQRAATDTDWEFRERAVELGVSAHYRNGGEAGHAAILESLGGGVALLDFDGDGRLDLFFPRGGTISAKLELAGSASQFFRQSLHGSFQDITVASGLDVVGHYTHGVTAADYDSDGFVDVVVTGYGGIALWHNEGDGTFRELHQPAALRDKLWSSSAAWGDFNGDGHLDLYLTHYVNWSPENHPYCRPPAPQKEREICSPKQFNGLPDTIYYSQGDGTFVDASSAAGLKPDGKGLGVIAVDVDLDGDLDLYVGNDTVENFLYLNDGQGRFSEVGLAAGVATDDRGVPDGSMGVDACDYNNDGQPDLWAANYEREAFALYRNEGAEQFLHVSQSTGITALGGLFVGFGTAFGDLDRDGDEDVMVANGHVIKFPTTAPRRQSPLLLENRRGSRFQRATVPREPYFSKSWESRGLALGDLNGDGNLDVAIAHMNEPSALLINTTNSRGDWVGVRLIGTRSNRTAIGSHLILKTSSGRQLRLVKGGGSYLSQSDYGVHWGVPAGATVEQLEIVWPSGIRQQLTPQLNQWQTIIETP
ncbi:MAG: CRTAC1 family protein [Planctomycetota bacterium]